MADIIKIVNADYSRIDAMQNLIKYIITDKERKPLLCSYYGGINIDPLNAFNEMMYVKKYFRKTAGRLVRHFIVSPEAKDFLPQELYYLAYRISLYYSNKYQIMFSVHENTNHLHIHFVINTVSFLDGKMFSEGPADHYRFRQYVLNLIDELDRDVAYQMAMGD